MTTIELEIILKAMKKKLVILTMIMIMSPIVQADRISPAQIKPITKNGTVYKDQFEATSTGFALFILAKKISNDSIIWKTKIYSKEFNKELETDVQEIYLSSLVLKKDKLIAVDETGKTYEISRLNGELLKP